MKKLFPFALVAIMLAACNNPDPEVKILIDPDNITCPCTGGEFKVQLTAKDEWYATSNVSWLEVMPSEGIGNTEVIIQISPNTTNTDDNAKIVFSDGKYSTHLAVTRLGVAAGSISVSPQELTVPSETGKHIIKVYSDVKWAVSCDASWIQYSPGVGKNNGEIEILNLPSNTTEVTTATLTISEYGGDPDNKVDVKITREGALKYFSVSVAKKVSFSYGNLQYKPLTGTWRFAENQYDMIGDGNNNVASQYNEWLDLFGWGTGKNPILVSTNNDSYTTYDEWGENEISNGGNTDTKWRTLTNEEWMYLFKTRDKATNLFGFGNVVGVDGLIILPDDWSRPSGVDFYPSTSKGLIWDEYYYQYANSAYINDGADDNYSHNTYDEATWKKMAANGAIFLPTAGYRNGKKYVADNGDYEKIRGNYWSSTPYEKDLAYALYFDLCYLDPLGKNDRNIGHSVRLVRDKR